jgi:hypothetical protein
MFFLCIIISILCYENFIYSSNFGLLTFRSINDTAFQLSLKNIHDQFYNLQLHKLISMNDYGYGWIYWFPMSLITYPFYLLDKYYDIAWPLIVIPRQISLFFNCLTLVYLSKLFRLFNFDKISSSVALLCFTLLPYFGFLSLEFSTANSILFFSVLSFYLACLEYRNEKKLQKSLIALSIAGGIKLSGLFVAPLVFLILFSCRSVKNNYKDFLIKVFCFVLLVIFFTNPTIFFFVLTPFKFLGGEEIHSALLNYFSSMKLFLRNSTLAPVESNNLEGFIFGVFCNYHIFTVFIILFIGYILLLYKKIKNKLFLLVFSFFSFLPIFYLFANVNNRVNAGCYFTSISFIFFLGLQSFHKSIKNIILFSILSLIVWSLIAENLLKHSYVNPFAYFIKAANNKDNLISSERIKTCLKLPNTNNLKLSFALDYQIPTELNPRQYPSSCFVYIYSNLSSSTSCSSKFDYFILDMSSPVFFNDIEFNSFLSSQDKRLNNDFLNDRMYKNRIVNGHEFNGSKYNLLCSVDNFNVYKIEP